MRSHSAKSKFERKALDRSLEDVYDLYVKLALQDEDPMANCDFCAIARPCWSLDDFTIVRQVGSGGMGTVFEALHVESGYTVALKEVVTMNYSQYIREEWNVHRSLNHPHIVKYYGGFVVSHEPEQESVYNSYSSVDKMYSDQDSMGLENLFNDLNLNECSTTSSSLPYFKGGDHGHQKPYRPRSIYFVLEYCSGGRLNDIINSPTWVLINSEKKVAAYARGIMEACCISTNKDTFTVT